MKKNNVVSDKKETLCKIGVNELQAVLHMRNKMLSAILLILLILLVSLPANSKGLSQDISKLETPTLTEKHAQDSSVPESGYTLTDVTDSVDPDNLPSNVITKYQTVEKSKYYELIVNPDGTQSYQEVSGPSDTTKEFKIPQIVPVYYQIDTTAPNEGTTEINDSVDNINAHFIGNIIDTPVLVDDGDSYYMGAGVYNKGTIGDINGDFLYNDVNATDSNSSAMGSAIYNEGEIGNITGDFIGNKSAYSGYGQYYSSVEGAISNNGKINSIKGDFIQNIAMSDACNIGGAAITNWDEIKDITGDFIENTVAILSPTDGSANGGAIYNYGDIDNIIGNFVNNKVSGGEKSFGGAIFNGGIIDTLKGNFIGNAIEGNWESIGGAIAAGYRGKFKTIEGNFIGNTVTANYGAGGAIGAIEYIAPNSLDPELDYDIRTIKGLFADNKVIANGGGHGGAIANVMMTGEIDAVFMNNSVSGAVAVGGAIYNNGKINSIEGVFIGNHVDATDVTDGYEVIATGGAIANESEIGTISGDFINNSVSASSNIYEAVAQGGAIFNVSYLEDVADTKALLYETREIYDTNDNVVGVIYNFYDEDHNQLTEDQIKDMLKDGSEYKLADDGNWSYYMNSGETLEEALANLIADGGIQKNPEDIFNENYKDPGIITSIDQVRNAPALTLRNANLIGNHADSNTGDAKGGAIYSEGNIKMLADNGETTLISGNYTKNGDVIDQNAIYIKDYSLIFDTTNESTIQVDDKIDGENYNFYVIGDDKSKVILNNNVDNAKITLIDTNLLLGKDEVLNGSASLTLNSGTLSMLNGSAGAIEIPQFTLNGNTNFAADVNLADKTMDRINAGSYTVKTAATLNVNYLNLLNDANQDKTYIPFADADLKNNVAYTGASPLAYSPIYKYQVDYLKETGEFLFTRGGGDSSNPSDNYNPSVLPTPVNSQAGGYTTQLQTFNYAFQHSDTFMQIPAAQRFAIKNQNKYALSPTGDATDVGVFSPLLTKYETGGIWFKPYASFENIPLKNGPKVNNINYGTLVGFDSNLKSIKHGWERVLTGYIGYNGATQNFSGVTSNQNGGILGTTATFYKGNFFNATTLSVGATAGSNNTMYGSEDYTMLLAGIADKFGYNFEFKEGKYIIQPSMLLSYSFVNTFDYRNAAGVNIQSDPLNALQLAPGIKFIMNTKNGWQPYIGVNMVWNIMDQTKVKANDVRLPSMSIDPYVEYGVGVQRKWGERFMGYAQAMVHNGGRNGISLNGGFRWAIGKK